MNEHEWLNCTDPQPILKFLWGKSSDRKMRLFACACCRRNWHLLSEERSRRAVDVAEGYADVLASEADRLAAARAAINATWDLDEEDDRSNSAAVAVCLTVDPGMGVDAAAVAHCAAITEDEPPAQAALVRDIFGSLLRPVAIDLSWLAWNDGTVVKLAQSIYDEPAFEHLPLLADALEEAGCHDADILDHCRQPGPHVRGCWVVDLVLGKE